jgi:hypothetical protein
MTHSLYLVGFSDKLIVWNEQTEEELFQVSTDHVAGIRRVMSSNNYILKTLKEGLKVLTIKSLKTEEFSVQNLLKA